MESRMATRIQLFGHSYVRRLKLFIRDHTEFMYNLQLQEPALVQYSGLPGASIGTLSSKLDLVQDFNPHILVLMVGTNDLYKDVSAPEVSQDLILLVDKIHSECKVPYIIIFQIFHRRKPEQPTRWPVNESHFNSKVDQLNLIVGSHFSAVPHVKFWRCNGFWTDDAKTRTIGPDGVHLTARGNEKLYYNVRAAVVSMMKNFKITKDM